MTAKRMKSFKHAIDGLKTALKDQPNFVFQFCAALLVIAIGFYFDLTKSDWLIVILTIGFVLAFELTNTAIEEIVNSFTDQVHPAAKKAKDVAAGAVLVAAVTAVVVGLMIFLPYIIRMLT